MSGMAASSPTARALLALEVIQNSPGITAKGWGSDWGSPNGLPDATSRSCARQTSRSSPSVVPTAAIAWVVACGCLR
jgi:hypothetical protein